MHITYLIPNHGSTDFPSLGQGVVLVVSLSISISRMILNFWLSSYLCTLL
uniref:Uncharacterized protein n=1 Tax=Rhizophora mucronata TaxID=61149 RepID=A0A2P2Q1G5_RHIMU